MFADIVDHQELLTGRRATGLIFSSSSMSQKLGWALGAALSGWILAWFHYVPDAISQSSDTVSYTHLDVYKRQVFILTP